jgi:hypothetical protein
MTTGALKAKLGAFKQVLAAGLKRLENPLQRLRKAMS